MSVTALDSPHAAAACALRGRRGFSYLPRAAVASETTAPVEQFHDGLIEIMKPAGPSVPAAIR